MAEKIKIGIIGCGGIANGKHLRAISGIDFLEPVAFCHPLCLLGILSSLWRISVLKNRRFIPFFRWMIGSR